jgi:hypothetical protein
MSVDRDCSLVRSRNVGDVAVSRASSLRSNLIASPQRPHPIVVLMRSFANKSVAIESVPALERHRIYRGRLVTIQGPDGVIDGAASRSDGAARPWFGTFEPGSRPAPQGALLVPPISETPQGRSRVGRFKNRGHWGSGTAEGMEVNWP